MTLPTPQAVEEAKSGLSKLRSLYSDRQTASVSGFYSESVKLRDEIDVIEAKILDCLQSLPELRQKADKYDKLMQLGKDLKALEISAKKPMDANERANGWEPSAEQFFD